VQKVTIKTSTPIMSKQEATPKAGEILAINHSNWNTLLHKKCFKSGLVNYKVKKKTATLINT
jgi:hypothetical protein